MKNHTTNPIERAAHIAEHEAQLTREAGSSASVSPDEVRRVTFIAALRELTFFPELSALNE